MYLTLLHFSKSLCSVAARSLKQICQTLTKMHQLRRRLLTDQPGVAPLPLHIDALVEVLDNEASVPLIGRDAPEVTDVIETQSRRTRPPRENQMLNQIVRRAKVVQTASRIVACDLCRGSHDLECSCS
jgi:hypothetical protein